MGSSFTLELEYLCYIFQLFWKEVHVNNEDNELRAAYDYHLFLQNQAGGSYILSSNCELVISRTLLMVKLCWWGPTLVWLLGFLERLPPVHYCPLVECIEGPSQFWVSYQLVIVSYVGVLGYRRCSISQWILVLQDFLSWRLGSISFQSTISCDRGQVMVHLGKVGV